MSKEKTPLPSMQDITDFLRTQDGKVKKRDIARAFKIHGDDRIALKSMLKELKQDGILLNASKNNIEIRSDLKTKISAEITGEDSKGNLIARPLNWSKDEPVPQIILNTAEIPENLHEGDMVLLKTEKLSASVYNGVFVRKLSFSPNRMVGLFSAQKQGLGGIVTSVDKRVKTRFYIDKEDAMGAKPNSVVVIEMNTARNNNTKARIIKIICGIDEPFASTVISAYQNNLPLFYPVAALNQVAKLPKLSQEGREDLRKVPLVTIDGADAKDFDDAVYAEPDEANNNKGGWKIIVAIADIAWFVRPGTAIDKEAALRGNSVYFPDRAIHMLPPEVTEEIVSLSPNKDRGCIAAHLQIDKDGKLLSYKFTRAIMNSAARLTYDEVEEIISGKEKNQSLQSIINNLYGTYLSLEKARTARKSIDIETPEPYFIFDDKGKIKEVKLRKSLKSHKIIEEFMITANVAAAKALEDKKSLVMYRVHEIPLDEKVSELNTYLGTLRVTQRLPFSPKPADFKRLLDTVKNTAYQSGVEEMVLRTQSRAVYSPENIGHFGLALESYAHFTSPIRRYADLLVHRCLISAYNLGEGGLADFEDEKFFKDMAEHISFTEKRAEDAERDADARYISLYLSDRTGQVFNGKIRGVSHSGLFITIADTCADGFVPVRDIPDDYFLYDADKAALIGEKTGKTYSLGQEVKVTVEETAVESGGILLALADSNGKKRVRKQTYTRNFPDKGPRHKSFKRKNLKRKHKR